jgi:hypothetical protein
VDAVSSAIVTAASLRCRPVVKRRASRVTGHAVMFGLRLACPSCGPGTDVTRQSSRPYHGSLTGNTVALAFPAWPSPARAERAGKALLRQAPLRPAPWSRSRRARTRRLTWPASGYRSCIWPSPIPAALSARSGSRCRAPPLSSGTAGRSSKPCSGGIRPTGSVPCGMGPTGAGRTPPPRSTPAACAGFPSNAAPPLPSPTSRAQPANCPPDGY